MNKEVPTGGSEAGAGGVQVQNQTTPPKSRASERRKFNNTAEVVRMEPGNNTVTDGTPSDPHGLPEMEKEKYKHDLDLPIKKLSNHAS